MSLIRLIRIGLVVVLFAITGIADATIIRMNFTINGQAYGSSLIRLYDTAMPRSVANFLNYVDRYAGTFIHRNPRNSLGGPDGNFVVQGGGFEYVPPSSAPPIVTDPPILDEPGGGVQGLSNLRGTIANAKSGPDTVTSQWFINLSDNSFLDSPARSDGGFAAFGRVVGVTGMNVWDNIDLLQKQDLDGSSSNLFNDVPVGDVNNALATLVTLSSVQVLQVSPGDYNLDGHVDILDYAVWRDTHGSTTNVLADGNGDGVVDAADYTVWRDAMAAASAGFSIPEPTAVVLTLVGLLATTRVRTR